MSKALELAKLVLSENDKLMSPKEIYDYAIINHKEVVDQTFNEEIC